MTERKDLKTIVIEQLLNCMHTYNDMLRRKCHTYLDVSKSVSNTANLYAYIELLEKANYEIIILQPGIFYTGVIIDGEKYSIITTTGVKSEIPETASNISQKVVKPMSDSHITPIYTEYRIVEEMYNITSTSKRPMLYIYPTRYNSHDEAIEVVTNAVHAELAVHNNNPADSQYEFIGDEYITEVFYRKPNGEKIIEIRYRICPIEAFEHLTSEKPLRYYNSYKYRGYDICENVLRNRFSVVINGRKTTKHKLSTLLDFIDECVIEMES